MRLVLVYLVDWSQLKRATNSNVIRLLFRRHNAETDQMKLMQALNLLHNEQLLNECRRNKADKNPSVTDERPDGSLYSIPSHSVVGACASPCLPHHYVDSAAAWTYSRLIMTSN